MTERFDDFVQTLSAEDVIPPDYAERLCSVTQAHAALMRELELEEQHTRMRLDRTRKIFARYDRMMRARLDRISTQVAEEKKDDAEQILAQAHVEAQTLHYATRKHAIQRVEESICDILEIAFERILSDIPHRERIAGTVRAVVEDVALSRPATLRVSLSNKQNLVAALHEVLGDVWPDVVAIEVEASMDDDNLELTTNDGTHMIGVRNQFEELRDALEEGLATAGPEERP